MNKDLLLSTLKVLLSCLFIVICTQLSYTINGSAFSIPVTGQSLAVLMVAYLFGGLLGSIGILLYLILGIIGLPVYADGEFGFKIILGPSGGFLYGFVLSSLLTNMLFKNRNMSFTTALQFMMIGTLFILIFGGIHLSFFTDLATVFNSGIRPFLPGAVVKILFGALIVYCLERYMPLKYFRFTS